MQLCAHLPASSVRINTQRVLLRTRRDRGCSAASLICILPVALSGVSAGVFRLAQLTGLLWRPTIALPIGTSRLHAADGMVVATAVDCTGAGSVVVLAQTSEPQCNPSCVPAFHRVGGWGVKPATRFVRYHFNCAVFPAASRSLTVFSGHLGRHAFQPCQGRAGR